MFGDNPAPSPKKAMIMETSEETQKDLEREKGAIQKQLNESFLQISALKVLALKVKLHETIRKN